MLVRKKNMILLQFGYQKVCGCGNVEKPHNSKYKAFFLLGPKNKAIHMVNGKHQRHRRDENISVIHLFG